MGRLLGLILIVEAVFAGLSTLRSIPALPGYDAITVALIVAGAGVGALQMTSGFLLIDRKPAGPALAQAALLISGVVTTLVTGLRLAPSDIYYWNRWQFVAGYWAYALAAIWYLRKRVGRS